MGCHAEVYNDSDRSIVAYYDKGRRNSPLDQQNIGIINARDYRDVEVDCTLERIMVRGEAVVGDIEVILTEVELQEGVRKLANLRLPRS